MSMQPSAPEGAFRPVEEARPQEKPPVRSFAWWKNRLFIRKPKQVITPVATEQKFYKDREMETDARSLTDNKRYNEPSKDGVPVVDSHGKAVTEYIKRDDPRYEDPAIPAYLKEGTYAYAIRQVRGGNYTDPVLLHQALDAVGQFAHPIKGEQGKKWYNEALIPAIDRLIWTGRIHSVAEIKAPSQETPINEEGLTQGLRELLTTVIPSNVMERAFTYADFDNAFPTLRKILQQLAKIDPNAFQVMLAKTMARGFEGYSLAEAIARSVHNPEPAKAKSKLPDGEVGFDTWEKFSKVEHPEQYRLPLTQGGIAEALSTLLDFPIPFDIEKTATGEFWHQTIGSIFANLPDEKRLQLIRNMQLNKATRIIGFEATHPNNPDYSREASQQRQYSSSHSVTMWGRNGLPYTMRVSNLDEKYGIHRLRTDLWQKQDEQSPTDN